MNAERLHLRQIREIGRRLWGPLARHVAAPGVVLTLFGTAMVLSLGSMLFTQRTSRLIVERDMRLVVSLGDAAAAFDHADGDLYRLMVDHAAGGQSTDVPARAAAIRRSLQTLSSDVRAVEPLLGPADRARMRQVLLQIGTYGQTIEVVASMLDVNFASTAAMMVPFRSNADQVLRDVRLIRNAGVADARAHAAASAGQGQRIIGLVAGMMTLLMVLVVVWMVLASHRGAKLRAEIVRRRSAEAGALELASRDPLTGLANRRVFVAAVDEHIARGSHFSVVLIDLDGFKQINDQFGHAAGDTVLVAVAERLSTVVRVGDTLARLGGDEFAALITGSVSSERPCELTHRFANALQAEVEWHGQTLRTSGSVGLAVHSGENVATDQLLHVADLSMYRDKAARKARSGGRLRAAADPQVDEFECALAAGEIVPFYQPIVDLVEGRVLGYEILARWLHPSRGTVMPDVFIPLAERSGQLTLLTETLLRQVCTARRALPDRMIFALNLAPMQLCDPVLADRLLAVIREFGVPPHSFEFEITETAALMDDRSTVANFKRLTEAGATFALDDFGVGFSNMANLAQGRFDRLKIDRLFVQRLPADRTSSAIVAALVGLADNLGLRITAEGVEEPGTADLLRGLGVQNGQGYLYGHPERIPAFDPAVADHLKGARRGQHFAMRHLIAKANAGGDAEAA